MDTDIQGQTWIGTICLIHDLFKTQGIDTPEQARTGKNRQEQARTGKNKPE